MSVTLNHHFKGVTQRSVKFLGTLSLVIIAHTTWSEAPEAVIDESQVIHQDTPKEEAKNKPTSAARPQTLASSQLARDQILADSIQSPTPYWLPYQQTKLLSFWVDNMSATPKGAILILPNPGEPPLSNHLIAKLLQNLPKHGWAAAALSLPEAPTLPIPPREEKTETGTPSPDTAAQVDETQVIHDDSGPTPDTKDTTQPIISWQEYEANMTAAIQAAIDELNSRGQYNIALMGEGTGAYLALRFLQTSLNQTSGVKLLESKTQKAKVRKNVGALVMLNYRLPSEATPDSLFTQPDILTLDLYVADLSGTEQAAQLRYLEASQLGYTTYLQRPLTLHTFATNPEATVKWIRGFLSRYAAGTELK